MPVIFNTATSHRIIMLNKDAELMLKMMQTSGEIPGALFVEAIPQALATLESQTNESENETEEPVSNNRDYVELHTRAIPLIELMQKAIKDEEKLLWDNG